MAAKTIQEAIQRGLTAGPLNQLEVRVLVELRDFFAHRAQIFDHKQQCALCKGKTLEFFNEVFKGVSPFLK